MDRRIQLHEKLYLILGGLISAALITRAIPAGIVSAIFMFAYFLILRRTQAGSVARVIAAYIVTWALYSGSSLFVEGMEMTDHGDMLAAMDRRILGGSAGEIFTGHLSLWHLEILSLGYMSYHLYLHWVLLDSLRRDVTWRSGLGERLFLAFGLGFAGYYIFPASPPDSSLPAIQAITAQGGFLTHCNEWINARMAARYDAFPSLHVLVTATLLAWDWRHARWRFGIMLVPSLLMLAATLALHLHYAVDLLVSAVLFFLLSLLHASRHLFSTRRSLGH